MGEKKEDTYTAEGIGNLFGVTGRRVQQLAKEGIIPCVSRRPYQFELIGTVRAYVEYLGSKANGKKDGEKAKIEEERLRAEADIKKSKAKITEMQMKELEGRMHRSEDVEAVMNDLVYTIRGMIMALPGRLAMDVVRAESPAEASAMIRAETNKLLTELARYKYDPEEYRRRVMDREGWQEVLADETDG